MFAKRTDANHKEISNLFRQFAQVRNMSQVGGGVLDLEVTHGKQVYFVEIKTAKGKVTPKQKAFIKACENAFIVRNADDVMLFIHDKTALRIKTLSQL